MTPDQLAALHCIAGAAVSAERETGLLAAPVLGDLIAASGTPTWARLAGSAVHTHAATDIVSGTLDNARQHQQYPVRAFRRDSVAGAPAQPGGETSQISSARIMPRHFT